MAYTIYTTRGIVLSYRALKEADRVYSVLTEDLGLIRATATGVRKETSKLRGALEPLTLVSISLVRGKEYWRLTSALSEGSLYESLDGRRGLTVSMSKALALLASLIQGEEAHPELFQSLLPVLIFSKHLLESEAQALEVLLLARGLFHLGYISTDDVSRDVIDGEVSAELFSYLEGSKKTIIQAINSGLEHSNLTRR